MNSSHEPVVVHRAAKKKDCADLALVLEAMGVGFQLARFDREWLLLVAARDERRAREQLARYAEENARFRPRVPGIEVVSNGVVGSVVYVTLLLVAFLIQKRRMGGVDWTEVGLSDSVRLAEGELWRPVTALTLHADLQHVASNLVFGALFGALVCQLVGNGLGWFAILGAGVLGNLVNAWMQVDPHRSLGASTAVLGALGLLVGHELVRRTRAKQGFVRRWAPLLFGGVLFSWFGASDDPRTDVAAHLWGFVAGILLGFPLGWIDRRHDLGEDRIQTVGAALTFAALLGAWAWGWASTR